MSAPLHVVHTVAGIGEREGGPSRTIPGLCRALGECGIDVELLTGETPDRQVNDPAETPYQVRYAPTVSVGGRRFPRPAAFARLLEVSLEPHTSSVVHDHGLWLPSNHAVAKVARRRRVPRIVSPRGMLSAWSLRYRGGKKRFLWGLFQRRDLERADALHATSQAEAEEFRAVGIENPIAVIANGITAPEGERDGSAHRRKRALFLSRIHPKKGLEALVDAWSAVRPAGWELVIAGPDEEGHRGRIERRVQDAGLGDTVAFPGAVGEDAKWDVYYRSDLFILPSLSENFGLAILEALATGLPVITTRAAPWSALTEQRCGWWTEVGAEPIAAALRDAVALSDSQRLEMGERGRAFVADRYGWDAIAREMEAVYRWMLGTGDPPACLLRS